MPVSPEAKLLNNRRHHSERPEHCNSRVAPAPLNEGKARGQQQDTEQPKINTGINKNIKSFFKNLERVAFTHSSYFFSSHFLLKSIPIRLFIHFSFSVINTSMLLNPVIIVLLGLLAFRMVTSSLWKSFLPLVSSTSHPPGSLFTFISHSS